MIRANMLETAETVVECYISGGISKPLVRSWKECILGPIDTAFRAVIEQERYRHLQDFLFLTVTVGLVGTVLSLLFAFSFIPVIKPYAYSISFFTAAAIVAAVLVHRFARKETFYSRQSQKFITAYNSFVRATRSESDERFTKLKFEELQERAHATLARSALVVRKIENVNEGIPSGHWEEKKKNAVKSFEALYELMRLFALVGNEGYRPYYDKAEELLKAEQATA